MKKESYIGFRVEPDMRKELEKKADKAERKLSDYLRWLLKRVIDKQKS